MTRPRPSKVCQQPGCPNLRPCPDHTPTPWATSTRRRRTRSGWAQQAQARKVMARDHGICHVCGQPGADRVDHVIPVAENGPDTMANKAPIHQEPCHRLKTAAEAQRARTRRQAAPRQGPNARSTPPPAP